MKKGSFDDRVAKCLAQFRDVEARSVGRNERQGLSQRVRHSAEEDGSAHKD